MEQDLIIETLESIRDYVPKLVAASEQLAQDIQSHEGGWVDTFVAYLEGMGWLTAAINGVQQLDQEVFPNWNLYVLAPLIEQLGAALEQQDFVTLCDLLQFEIQPLLQSYNDELQGIVR